MKGKGVCGGVPGPRFSTRGVGEGTFGERGGTGGMRRRTFWCWVVPRVAFVAPKVGRERKGDPEVSAEAFLREGAAAHRLP